MGTSATQTCLTSADELVRLSVVTQLASALPMQKLSGSPQPATATEATQGGDAASVPRWLLCSTVRKQDVLRTPICH